MATTGFKLGFEGSDFSIYSNPEATRGTNPDSGAGSGSDWQNILLLDFTPNHTKSRSRVESIRRDKQLPKGVTTQIACQPTATVPFTTAAFNPWISALLNNDQFTANACRNSTIFQSFYLIQYGGADNNFAYPGAWPASGTLNIATGQFAQFTFNFFAQDRLKIPDSVITDPLGAPNSNAVFDPVTLATQVSWNGSQATGVIDFTLNHNKSGAEQLYELGSPSDTGIAMGSMDISGTMTAYFNDFSYFDDFVAETEGPMIFTIFDKTNKGYTITMPVAILTSHDDPIPGPGPIQATINFEASPDEADPTPYTIEYLETV